MTTTTDLTPEQRFSLLLAVMPTVQGDDDARWADAVTSRLTIAERLLRSTVLDALPTRELTGQVVRIEQDVRRRDGSPAGYVVVHFRADIGNRRDERLYANRALPSGAADPAGQALIARLEQLIGQPVRLLKEGRNERVGDGGRVEHSWYVRSIEPLDGAPATPPAPTAEPAYAGDAGDGDDESDAGSPVEQRVADLTAMRPTSYREVVELARSVLRVDEGTVSAVAAQLARRPLDDGALAHLPAASSGRLWQRLVELYGATA